MAVSSTIAALLGVSTYALPPPTSVTLDSPQVERARRQRGGQLGPRPATRLRWYIPDLERAERMADAGDMSAAGQLCRTMDRDGVLRGVLSTLAGGLVRLPKRWRGPDDIVGALQQGGVFARSVFEEMCPPSELERMVADSAKLGVAVGELVEVQGRDFPVLVRRSPEALVYRWEEQRWYYNAAVVGPIPITPGDGRWVLHTPGGREAPWHGGIWRALGRAYITKEHARLLRDNWENKLANPARVAVNPQGAPDHFSEGLFKSVLGWGINTVFGLPAGYDVKIVESNGRGADSWKNTIAEQNAEMIIAVAGQTVTTEGGVGFANADIHKSIRADIIKAHADALAYTLNTQVLPSYVQKTFGEDRLYDLPALEWDVTPPHDQQQVASALTQGAGAIKALREALEADGLHLDTRALASRFGVPLRSEDKGADVIPIRPGADVAASVDLDLVARAIELARAAGLQPTEEAIRTIVMRAGLDLERIPEGASEPKSLDLAPTDLAKVIKAIEARASQGLQPFGDERDQKTVSQLGEEAEADAEAETLEEEAA